MTCTGAYCAPLTPTKVYINGQYRPGPPAEVALRTFDEIALVIGSPPPSVPASYDCHDAAAMEQASCQGFLSPRVGG